MTVNKVYQVVGCRVKEYKLFKMVLETHEDFRTSFLERIRDDNHNITINDVYSLLNDLIDEKKIDKRCKCKHQKKDRDTLVKETLDLIPDVVNIIHDYDVYLCKRCIYRYTFDYICDSMMIELQDIELPNKVKIFRITHDLGSEDFIVGVLLNEIDFDERGYKNDLCNGISIDDIIKKSEIVTETIKSIGWDIDPKPRVHILQDDCCCCS